MHPNDFLSKGHKTVVGGGMDSLVFFGVHGLSELHYNRYRNTNVINIHIYCNSIDTYSKMSKELFMVLFMVNLF